MAAMRSGARNFRHRNGICCNNILNKTPPPAAILPAAWLINLIHPPRQRPLHGYRPIPITGH
jgi:hypothetical protein